MSEISALSDSAAETEGAFGPIPAAAAPGHGRIDDIELLRAFAILFTLGQHLTNLTNWSKGEHFFSYFGLGTGVDLFFAISGFVIARSLLPQLGKTIGDYAFIRATLSFWVRRAWRILPSSWLWLIIILALSVTFNQSGAFGLFQNNFEATLAGLMNFANFRFADTYGRSSYGASFQYWSLSLEEQFYLLLPIFSFLFKRRLPLVLAVWVFIGLFLPRQSSLFLLMTRTEGLLLGVLLAVWSRHASYRLFEPTGLKSSWPARWFTLLLLLGCLATLTPRGPPVVFFAQGLVSIVSAALVFLASYNQDYLWKAGPLKSVMMWIGARSYAIYLIHIPAFFATREIWWRIEPAGTVFDGRFTLRYLATAALLIIALSEANYRLVEMPLREHGARIAKRLAQRPLPA
jgi:peptidoglycan/LPS O-acetylase OafA/YrhL